jgi:hypothetical protein
MNVSRLTLLILAVLALTVPAVQAGTVTFTVSDDLGPVITSDPLGLAGGPFSLTGTVTQGPAGQTTYTVDSLTVTATASTFGITETLQACGTPAAPSGCAGDTTTPTLTITPDSASLIFDVAVKLGTATFIGNLSAAVNLPSGTLEQNGVVSLANFSDVPIQSGSTLSYKVAAVNFIGEVGVGGTASMSGVTSGPPPTVPEPGTIALLAGGLLGLVFRKRLNA